MNIKAKKYHKYRFLIFQENVTGKVFKKYLIMCSKGLVYATKFLKQPSMKFVRTKLVELPRENENSTFIIFFFNF